MPPLDEEAIRSVVEMVIAAERGDSGHVAARLGELEASDLVVEALTAIRYLAEQVARLEGSDAVSVLRKMQDDFTSP